MTKIARFQIKADESSRTTKGQADEELWEVVCDCGTIAWVKADDLKSGKSTSCGKCDPVSSETNRVNSIPFARSMEFVHNRVITKEKFHVNADLLLAEHK